MDTKALRQKVLDLAIRGKLVPQDPNDEPASVLLERIRQQKKQMVRDGKLKPKDIKNDTIIFVGEDNLHYEKFADGSVKCIEDEIPFDLPEGWAWSRLGTVAEAIGDGDHQPPPQTSSGVPFLVISNVSGGQFSFENTRFVSEEYFSQLPETRKPRNGDLLFTVTGSYGIPVLVDTDDKFCFQRHIAIVRPCIISNRYFYVVLGSSYVKSICDAKATGTAQKTVGLATLRELLIPVAPYKEQMQIYAQTQDALSIVDSISSDKEDLLNIIENTKAKILNLAIRGQLVPQDLNDEPASVLLERTRSEKEELIRQGKIKRDKKESVIFRGEDNSYYFDIPDGWALCPLKELFNVCSAKRVRQSDWRTEGVPFYRAREIVKLSDNGFVDNDLFISEEHYIRVKAECGVPEPGDLMVSGVGTIGKVYVVNSDDRFYYKDASVLCFENRTGVIDSQFARYMLESEFMQAQMKDNSKGTTVDTITISAAMEYVCVLPPLAEQKRIVSAIETAFVHLKSISDALT